MKSKEQAAEEFRKQFAADGSHLERCSHMSFLSGVEFAESWISVEDELPEAAVRVYAVQQYINEVGKIIMWQTMAQYIPPMTINADDFLDPYYADDLQEYNEEDDIFYVKEGWFETNIESDINYKINDIKYWKPQFPMPPKNK